MTRYLFVESRSEGESPDVTELFDLVRRLPDAGHEVVVFLVQNAVLPGGRSLGELVRSGVEVWADGYSMVARGYRPHSPPVGVQVCGMPEVVRLLMTPGVVPVWH